MQRREFVKTVAAATVGAFAPATLFAHDLRMLAQDIPGHESFPHVNAPRIARSGTRVSTFAGALCVHKGKRVRCPALFGTRMIPTDTGGLTLVGWRGPDLLQVQIDSGMTPAKTVFARNVVAHPAVGLDVVATPRALLVVAPGETAGTLKLYGAPEGDRLLVEQRWVQPLMAFDHKRERLHLVFAPWNASSSIYDVIYYLRSDDYGRTWTKSDGKKLELPIKPYPTEYGQSGTEPDVLSVRGQASGPDANTLPHSLVLDRDGQPHLLYSFCRPYWIAAGAQTAGPVEPSMRTRHLRVDGKAWVAIEIDRGWSMDVAGGSLAFDDQGTLHALVVCKQKHNQWLDLGHTSSADHGRNWSPIVPVSKYDPGRESHYLAPQFVIRKNTADFVCLERNLRKATALQGSFTLSNLQSPPAGA